MTTQKELSCTSKIFTPLSESKKVKTTHRRIKNIPIFGVILTPDWESKELFFRRKHDPHVGAKLGVKVTPKRGLSCT